MSRQYIRTDKNGTKIYHDYTCPRCGGRGGADAWAYTGWTCYECGGSGQSHKPQVIKEYTPEYRAKLDAQAEKRREKKMAQAQAEKAGKQAEWKQSKGFLNDRIHIVSIDNSYDLRDSIKAAGGRYNGETGWYFSEARDEFQTVELTAEEVLDEDAWGNLNWKWRNDIRELVEARRPAPARTSEYIGKEGDKLELEVTHKHTGSYETKFGVTYIHSFEDADGNTLVWKTSAYGGFDKTQLKIKGTVKEHSEYRGVKQTVLTRCKVS